MSGIIEVTPGESGLTLDGYIRNSSGQLWNGSSFETFNVLNLATYPVSFTEQGAMGYYTVAFPSTIPAGLYSVQIKRRAGGSPSVSDITEGSQTMPPWDGSNFESGWSTTSRTLTTGGAVVLGSDPLSQENLGLQLLAVQNAIVAALSNPFGSWRVGQVEFDQTRYLEYLAQLQTDLAKLMRSTPSESYDTVENAIGPMGHDATEFIDENI